VHVKLLQVIPVIAIVLLQFLGLDKLQAPALKFAAVSAHPQVISLCKVVNLMVKVAEAGTVMGAVVPFSVAVTVN
jgi:hypothetical protein